MRLRHFIAAATLLSGTLATHADSVTYTLSGSFSGILGATAFSGVAGTFTFNGDTAALPIWAAATTSIRTASAP